MNSKGVEMSLQTMVVAALVVIILVILTVLLVRQTGIFGESINACEDKGSQYRCMSTCGAGYDFAGAQGCGEGQVCCVETDTLLGTD